MKNLKTTLSALLIILLFISCSVEDDIELMSNEASDNTTKLLEGESLTFGRFYGKCEGNTCIDIFNLTGDTLTEDRLDNYPSTLTFYNGKFQTFKGAEKIFAQDLLNEFPQQLLNSKERVIGLPDAADWGGIYIEYENERVHQFWLIDLNTDNIPKHLRNYIGLVSDKIDEIQSVNSQF